jgi:non-ribosomal peptide synthetase component F
MPALRSSGLALTPVDVGSVTAKFDLTLSVVETDGSLRASLEYSTDLFDPPTADRMLDHLGKLLESALAEPDRPVSALPMLTEEEQRMLTGGNEPEKGYEDDADVAVAGLDDLSEDELDALIDRV